MMERLRGALIRDEGLQLRPYKDSVGKLTIGVGRNLEDVGLSRAEVDLLLDNDIARVRLELARFHWFTNLDTVRQAAIINMGFNLGLGGLLGFRQMIAALERQDWDGAAAAMLDSRWAEQVGMRAQRLANQVRSGEWA